jgi:hypothetical protein
MTDQQVNLRFVRDNPVHASLVTTSVCMPRSIRATKPPRHGTGSAGTEGLPVRAKAGALRDDSLS